MDCEGKKKKRNGLLWYSGMEVTCSDEMNRGMNGRRTYLCTARESIERRQVRNVLRAHLRAEGYSGMDVGNRTTRD